MKKLVALLLALCIALSMVGCVPASDENRGPDSESVAEPTARPTPTPHKYEPVYAHNANVPVKWRDENFKHLIYDAMGWDYSKEVTPIELGEIKELFILSDQRILINQTPAWDLEPEANGTDYIWRGTTYTESVPMNLDDLINFISLESLKVCLVEVETIDFLPYIHHLKYLRMSGCGIEDISVLPKCPNLRCLTMAGNNISDISPVGEMALWDLFLPHNNISDISPLNFIKKLPHQIVLSYNNISDISALAPHGRDEALAYLNLRNNNISDITPLEGYENISILSLTNNNITDVSPLAGLNKINEIYLGGNPVENISVLSGFHTVYTSP